MARFKFGICAVLYAAQFAALGLFAADCVLHVGSVCLSARHLVARKYAPFCDAEND